jgi:rubrerythrin
MALSIPMNGVCAASVTSVSDPAAVVAARALDPRTRADLEQSMRGEAFAHASYGLYAEQARREGLPAVARLFERAAEVELGEHFTEQAALIGLVGSDTANLRDAIKGEKYETRDMYPRFARQATSDGDANAATRFNEIARRYILYAKHASAQGNPALARLFTANATAELQEHFAEQAILAGLVGTTRSNLEKAIAGERHESQTMYPTFAKRAEAAGDTAAARVFIAHRRR